MFDGRSMAVGIRLRTEQGAKFAVKGSQAGLFIPQMYAQPELYICEGPTDTAAAISVGLYAIGRPSCLGCVRQVVEFVRRNRVRRVIVCADSDAPGQRGATEISQFIPVRSTVFTPPGKDLRAAVSHGLTGEAIRSMVDNLIDTQPVVVND